MSRSEPETSSPQRQREYADPDEGVRPLPWFMMMLLGAMTMWGAFYIFSTPSGGESSGDQRTMAALRPPEHLAGAAAEVDGKQIYGSKCVACHQPTGQGVAAVFPPLATSEWVLGDEKVLINIVLHGINGHIEVKGKQYKGAMPAWKDMSDVELAAVMSYIRSAWGNQAAPIKPATVKAQRETTQSRTEPYKSGQELKSAF
jgi:mono/diheme cytochrome c family protein